MSEQAERVHSVAPARSVARDSVPAGGSFAPDAELVRLCAQFYRDHTAWVDLLSGDALEQPPRRTELERLRSAWKTARSQIRAFEPTSLPGACAKLRAALAFIAWSSENDGAATDFLIVAATQVQSLLRNEGLEGAQLHPEGSRQESGRRQWINRLTGRPWFAHERRDNIPAEVRRSQT